MDDTFGRELIAQLIRLVKAQERIAAALEATNAADPLAMIQASLDAGERVTAAQDATLDDEADLAAIRAYVAALR